MDNNPMPSDSDNNQTDISLLTTSFSHTPFYTYIWCCLHNVRRMVLWACCNLGAPKSSLSISKHLGMASH